MTDDFGGRRPNNPLLSFLGAAIMAVGILILVLSGLCTGIGLFVAIHTALTPVHQDASGVFEIVLMFGVPPIVIGVGLFFLGRALRR